MIEFRNAPASGIVRFYIRVSLSFLVSVGTSTHLTRPNQNTQAGRTPNDESLNVGS